MTLQQQPETTHDSQPAQASPAEPAFPSSPNETRHLRTLKVVLALQTAGFVILAGKSFTFPINDIEIVVLTWAWSLFALASLIAYFLSRNLSTTPGVISTITILAVLFVGIATLAYFVVYDVFRTPRPQVAVDLFCGLGICAEVYAGFALRKSWPPALTAKQWIALLSAIPVLTLFGAWNTYVYAPRTSQALVNIELSLSSAKTTNIAGQGRAVPIVGTIALENAGKVNAGITGSFFKITARPVGTNDTGSDFKANAAKDKNIADAIEQSQALEPLGNNAHRLDADLPSSNSHSNLVELDDITDSRTYIQPGETIHRTFAAAIPTSALGAGVVLTFEAKVFFVNGVVQTFTPCDKQLGVGSVEMKSNPSASGGGWISCYNVSLPSRTPVGDVFGDEPGLHMYFVVDDDNVPGSETGDMFETPSSDNHEFPGTPAAILAAQERLFKLYPAASVA